MDPGLGEIDSFQLSLFDGILGKALDNEDADPKNRDRNKNDQQERGEKSNPSGIPMGHMQFYGQVTEQTNDPAGEVPSTGKYV